MRGAATSGDRLRRGSSESDSRPDDERHARAELRRQIGRLELELARLTFAGFGRLDVPHRVAAAAPRPRLLDLGALEQVRDELAERAGEADAALAAKADVEAANRELLRALIESPGDHRWLRISRADVGEPGCGHWHSLPRLGPLGMLMGWWRVRISSGCPRPRRLAAASGDPASGHRRHGVVDDARASSTGSPIPDAAFAGRGGPPRRRRAWARPRAP